VNQKNGRRKRRWWLWSSIAAVLIVIVVAAAFAARTGGTKIPEARLAKVTRGDISKSVVATGPIQPITKVELKSKASGLVERLYVDINQMVHKGQVLAQGELGKVLEEYHRLF